MRVVCIKVYGFSITICLMLAFDVCLCNGGYVNKMCRNSKTGSS